MKAPDFVRALLICQHWARSLISLGTKTSVEL